MTNKQAVGVIKFEIACVNRQDTPQCTRDCKKCDLCLPTEDVLQAYEMAIKALSQQPCDVFDKYGNYKYPSDVELTEPNTATSMPCDDAISRKDVINAIDKWISEYKPQHYLIQSIRELPSVTQKSGKWIIRDDLSTVRYYQCSECNEIDLDYSDYCPNCGAKMFEPQESEVRNESKG